MMLDVKIIFLMVVLVAINEAYRQSPAKRARGYRSPISGRYGGASSSAYRSPAASYENPIAAASAIASSGYARPVRQVRQEVEPRPEPYDFQYDNTDEFGTRLARTETGDENGVVRGSYSYTDANGLYRTVEYYADDTGFHATVNTNEPGVISHKPADAEYLKQ